MLGSLCAVAIVAGAAYYLIVWRKRQWQDHRRREQAVQELADENEFEMIENPMANAGSPTYVNTDSIATNSIATNSSSSIANSSSSSASTNQEQPVYENGEGAFSPPPPPLSQRNQQAAAAAEYSEPGGNAEVYAQPTRSGVQEAAMYAALDDSTAMLYSAGDGIAGVGTAAGGGADSRQVSNPPTAALDELVYQNVQQDATHSSTRSNRGSSSSAYENVGHPSKGKQSNANRNGTSSA